MNGYRRLYPDQSEQVVNDRALEIFTHADTDHSGAIDFSEWCTATINQNTLLNEKNMRAAFALFDKDGGGTIEANEIATILGHDVHSEDAVWTAVIAEVDTNGDGLIDFEEFTMMLLKLADQKV
jgi:calcium-dependent protein kinase